jgi:hypothetical protein
MFLENTWFQRAWIVQEMVVAEQIDLICGKRTIPWPWVAGVLAIISGNGLSALLTRLMEGELSISQKAFMRW